MVTTAGTPVRARWIGTDGHELSTALVGIDLVRSIDDTAGEPDAWPALVYRGPISVNFGPVHLTHDGCALLSGAPSPWKRAHAQRLQRR